MYVIYVARMCYCTIGTCLYVLIEGVWVREGDRAASLAIDNDKFHLSRDARTAPIEDKYGSSNSLPAQLRLQKPKLNPGDDYLKPADNGDGG